MEVRGTNPVPAFIINQTAPNQDILQVKKNNATKVVIDQNGNVGIGTMTPSQSLYVNDSLTVGGCIYNKYTDTIWIPGSSMSWYSTTPTLNTPTGITFSYITRTANYRYVGTDLYYNFNISGTVSGTASDLNDNYTLALTYPTNNTSNYQYDTIVGNLVINAYTPTGSNVYSAFARTVQNDNTILALRYLNGTYERSLSDIQSTSTLILQGQVVYNTTSPNMTFSLPSTFTTGTFSQDTNSNIIYNAGGQVPTGTMEIRGTNPVPTLVLNQTASTYDIAQFKQSDVLLSVFNNKGNLGIGTTIPSYPLHVVGPISPLTITSGTSSNAPVTFLQGSNLTTPIAGTLEYDGARFYGTADTTSGRGFFPTQQIFRLPSDSSAIGSAIANYFGTGSAINLAPGATYEIEANCYFTKTTSATVTVTLTTTQAVANLNGHVDYSDVTATNGSLGRVTLIKSATTANAFSGVTNVATGANHAWTVRAILESNASSASTLTINFTSSGGTVTPLRGSYYKVTRLPETNQGIYS